MKKNIYLLFLSILIVPIFFESKVHAFGDGLLYGVPTDRGRTELTDNNLNTFVSTWRGSSSSKGSGADSFSFTLGTLLKIQSFKIHVNNLNTYHNQYVRFYDYKDDLIKQYNVGVNGMRQVQFDGYLEGVYRIELEEIGKNSNRGGVAEFEIYGVLEEDVLPPKEVSNINVIEGFSEIFINWENPTDNDFSHVNIYKNGLLYKSGIKVQEFIDIGVVNGANYTYKITTVDDIGNESAGIEIHAKTLEKMKEIVELKANAKHDRINLSWKLPQNYQELSHVKIYRKEINETVFLKNLLINEVYANGGFISLFETNGTYFNDLSVLPATTYEYLLTTNDENGNESEGVTIQVTTLEEPVESIDGVGSGIDENGDYVYTWTSPTKGEVKIIVGGQEYATVPASDGQITILKDDMKYTVMGNPDVRLVPISESGKEGRPVNPNIPFSGTQIPLKVDDLLTTSMSLIWILAPFILLVLAIIYAKKIIQVIRKSVETRRSARQGGVMNERRRS